MEVESRKLHLNFNNSYNYNQNNIDNQIITSNHNNDDNESNLTCSKLKKWKYSNNTPKLKLINDYRTSLIKSRKHAIQLLNTQNKLPYLSEIQCSYELLNQRNNSLLQQCIPIDQHKIVSRLFNSHVESLSSILHKSRKQNIQSKRIIENLKTYLYKLCHTINQFISGNDQVTNVHYDNKLPSENINSKKSIRQFFHHINHQLQEVINTKQIEQLNMKTKITTLENEAKRRRHCIQELRLRLQNNHIEQLTKEKTNETLKLTEIHLQQTIKTQRCQLQILINEKKQLNENFTQLKQAHHHLVNELNELKLTLMNFNKSKYKNSMKNLDNDVKQTKIVNRICYVSSTYTFSINNLYIYIYING
ncbi:WAS/WASL-interacting protein [Schistosoma japonicum]|nr:WAS/WASL-interacting protein [Schistosoma japonicum]